MAVRVTENGVFDKEDRVRPAFLRAHLAAVLDALQRGANVRGYFHWSLIDNFEWAEGVGRRARHVKETHDTAAADA